MLDMLGPCRDPRRTTTSARIERMAAASRQLEAVETSKRARPRITSESIVALKSANEFRDADVCGFCS